MRPKRPSQSRIRRLFLEPSPTYSLPDAAKLLLMKPRELQRWLESGELEGIETDAGVELPWSELVSFAMEWWSQDVVEAALGKDMAAAIPELLRLTELQVRVPRFEVVALERVAARDRKSMDAVLARELLDFVSAHSEWLHEQVEGFGEILGWPSGSRTTTDTLSRG